MKKKKEFKNECDTIEINMSRIESLFFHEPRPTKPLLKKTIHWSRSDGKKNTRRQIS